MSQEVGVRPGSILRHELLGLPVTVTGSTDPGLIDASGLVVDETKNMLHILSGGRVRKIPKSNARFAFTLNNGTLVEVDGEKLVGRPEDRVRRRKRRW